MELGLHDTLEETQKAGTTIYTAVSTSHLRFSIILMYHHMQTWRVLRESEDRLGNCHLSYKNYPTFS
jgi:hypothetical protein